VKGRYKKYVNKKEECMEKIQKRNQDENKKKGINKRKRHK
jgi:predicted glycosyl hydrolase (DUF1957 family)